MFSLLNKLIDSSLVDTIAIVQGNPDGGDEDSRGGMHSADKSGGYCAAKTTPSNKSFALKVLQHPLRPAVPV